MTAARGGYVGGVGGQRAPHQRSHHPSRSRSGLLSRERPTVR